MKPISLSATAMQVAGLCLSRYNSEMIERGRGIQNIAASLGTSVHNSLEMYVKTCYLEMDPTKKQSPEIKYLLELFKMNYIITFGTSDINSEEYVDGVDMLKRWHKRTDFTQFTVISSEVKKNFPVKTSIGPIPFNYILDRLDLIGPNEYRVNDYKTNRAGLRPEGLRDKWQARCYALAMQIEHPDASRIWVEFDMLRHDGPVGISFSREDNAATWRHLKSEAERIIATDGSRAPETLNAECLFCVKKASCNALRKNLAVGGVFSIGTAAEAVDLRAQLGYQKKAIESAISEIDNIILAEASTTDVYTFESETNIMEITAYARRGADAELVERVIGEALFKKYAGTKITIANIDKLLKGTEIDDDQKRQLKNLIRKQMGEPTVKTHPKNTIDED